MLRERAGVRAEARWLRILGMDGFTSSMLLSDALAGDVMLADALDGAPLAAEAGAQLRLIAPAHYGYRSVKHVYAIEYRRHYHPGPAGWMAHRRGRVVLEELSRYLPGWVWRPLWRATLPAMRRAYDRGRQLRLGCRVPAAATPAGPAAADVGVRARRARRGCAADAAVRAVHET